MTKKKTIAQELNVKEFPFRIKDKMGNEIYREYGNGYWSKSEYDDQSNEVYYENSNGSWVKWEYNAQGRQIYFENSNGFWVKREYDANGKEIYYEDSDGDIIDKRPKQREVTMDEIAKLLNIDVNQLKIKK